MRRGVRLPAGFACTIVHLAATTLEVPNGHDEQAFSERFHIVAPVTQGANSELPKS